MLFAPAAHLQKSFGILDDIIYDNLPSDKDSKKIVAQKIAVIHNEFNAVHPFREGNGRTIRLFLDLLSVSLGFGLINFDSPNYIQACLDGMCGQHQSMADIVLKSIE